MKLEPEIIARIEQLAKDPAESKAARDVLKIILRAHKEAAPRGRPGVSAKLKEQIRADIARGVKYAEIAQTRGVGLRTVARIATAK